MTTATTNLTTGMPIQIENGITNFQPDLADFYFPEVCYLAESKRIKEKGQGNFETWKAQAEAAMQYANISEKAKRFWSWCLPDVLGHCTKNVVKNTTKKLNDSDHVETSDVKTIMAFISVGLEEYAKLNASWKANKTRLLSGKRPAEKPDPMLVWVNDAVALKALEELASDSKEQIKSAWLKSANVFIAKCIATHFIPPYLDCELNAAHWTDIDNMRKRNHEYFSRVQQLFTKEVNAWDTAKWNREQITADQLEVLAKEYADGVWMDFIHKMGQKIGGLGIESLTAVVIEKAWSDEEGEVQDYENKIDSDNHWQSELICKARNGVTFKVVNSIVWKCNEYGTHYVQFPARFSDVKQNAQAVLNSADVSSVRRICDFKATI